MRVTQRQKARHTPRIEQLPSKLTGRQLALGAAVAALWYLAWLGIDHFGRYYNFFDMKIYHGAVDWWLSGRDLYDFIAPGTTLGYTYPPFAALTMLPMAAFDTVTAGWVNVGLGLAALGLALYVMLGPIADRYGWPRLSVVALAVPLFAMLEPVRESLGYGQVNLVLFALVCADLVALRRGWAWAGMGIGLATAIKITPALFIVYLLVSRQWRAAFTAGGTALGATLLTHLIVPRESAAYFGSMLWETSRVGNADFTPNQSLAGLLARLHDSVSAPGLLWVAFTLVILAVGLSRANAAHADGDELAAFTLIGLTTNVVSPISWTHHLVWVIPAIVILVDQAVRRRRAGRAIAAKGRAARGLRDPIWFPRWIGARHATAALAAYAVCLVAPIWAFEHKLPAQSHYADGLLGLLAENSLAITLIALVAALPWRPASYLTPPVGHRVPRQGQLTHSPVPSVKT